MELLKITIKKTNVTYNQTPSKKQNNRIKSIKKRIRIKPNQTQNKHNLNAF